MPLDGGPSYLAGISSAEVAAVALVAFLLLFVVGAFTTKSWFAELAFLVLVAGGLLVSWPVMILLTGGAVALAAIASFAHKLLLPGRAARIEAEADAMARSALGRLRDERDKGSP